MKTSEERERKAVALAYPQGVEAPIITAKGTGKRADLILEAAKENNITVKEDFTLVDLLGIQQEGSAVPESAWGVLADIFSIILKSSKNS